MFFPCALAQKLFFKKRKEGEISSVANLKADGKAAPASINKVCKCFYMMASSVVKDMDIQETRAGVERARKKQGHLKSLGRLVLFAPSPHPLDGLLQWSVRPISDVDNLPILLGPLDKMTITQRCTNVALGIRGHKPHLFNVFARVEGGSASITYGRSAFFSDCFLSFD